MWDTQVKITLFYKENFYLGITELRSEMQIILLFL